MAEGLVNHHFGDQFEAHSAGAKVESVHPLAIQVMHEIGVDISGQRSKTVDEYAGQGFDFVITLCAESAKEFCPVFLGEAGEKLYWNFQDPAEAVGSEEEVLEEFRKVRDDIMKRFTLFTDELRET